ncbi:gibberellin 2-beta-dioxygenase 8-like [Iris pallida]|uniref:Gibberellin 2-beta-dioxygenase 8-like n=1 Tax=Iris pallida TaxID=29817 RepID=A0AAX6EEH2_IRIPA|nr:gibberellin 2-beta-dioxygenase 8-like [Iris pallida]
MGMVGVSVRLMEGASKQCGRSVLIAFECVLTTWISKAGLGVEVC